MIAGAAPGTQPTTTEVEGANARTRQQALARLAKGDADVREGRFADAVKRYGQAWALLA